MGVVGNLQYTPSKVVIHALRDIKKSKGVSFEEILSYAVGKYKVNQNTFKTALKHALRRGLKYQILNVHNGRYKLCNLHQKFNSRSNQKSERGSKKATNRSTRRDLKKKKKKTSIKRRCFRANLRKGKRSSDRPTFRLRKANLEPAARRRAESVFLRSESRDTTSVSTE